MLVQLKRPLELQELEIPVLRHGQVLVKILASGICGSQLGEIDGAKGEDRYLPHLLGHEGCGEVLEVGAGVSRVRAGDRVVMHWRKAAGHECEPPRYGSARGPVNAGWVTTLSREAVVSENRVTPVPSTTPVAVAALMGCATTTGMGVITHDARVKIGESLLLLGSGGIGLSTIQAARLAGAFPIVAVDRFANRLELAGQLGADHCLDSTEPELESRLAALAPDGGYDVVIESTGHVPFIESAYRLAQPQGRIVLVGVPRAGDCATLFTLPLHFGKTLTGSHGGESQPDRDIPRYLRLYGAGRLNLDSLISRTYALEEVNQAIGHMRSGAFAGRCIISPVAGPGSA